MKKYLLSILLILLFSGYAYGLQINDTAMEWNYESTATAGNVNSGGFKNGASGTDWSIYPTCKVSWKDGADGTCAQASATNTEDDLSCTNASPSVCSSATYNFTAADVGNTINIISGTNATAGRYLIASVASNEATLDRNAMTDTPADDITANMGGALLLPTDALWEEYQYGNKIYIKGGATYTLGAAISTTLVGTSDYPIYVIGYTTTKGDTCNGTSRPTLDAEANVFSLGNYWRVSNLIFTSTQTSGLNLGTNGHAVNVKATNTGTANKSGLTASTYHYISSSVSQHPIPSVVIPEQSACRSHP